MAQALNLPSLARAVDFLESSRNPIIEFQLALMLGDDRTVAKRRLVAEIPAIVQGLESQRSDGSWGEREPAAARLLPTLWMAKTLGELGLSDDDAEWSRAIDFLIEAGSTDGGVFSIRGTRDGVLSCYVGIAGSLYLAAGRVEMASRQVEWIVRHQEVKSGGETLRPGGANWGSYLRERYGGCMSDTTCLVGLLRVGDVLRKWLAVKPNDEGRVLLDAIREVFLQRRVMFRSNGSVIPLAVSPKNAGTWLAPTYPLDWRVDLIEAIDFLAHSGPPDPRIQDAVDHLVGLRLPDGTWPLRRAYQPEHLPKLERLSAKTGSPLITMRVVRALRALGAP